MLNSQYSAVAKSHHINFDTLELARHKIVRPADRLGLVDAADFANRHLPDLNIDNLSSFRRLTAFDPDCIQLFDQKGNIGDIYSMRFLNDLGLSVLANGDLIVVSKELSRFLGTPMLDSRCSVATKSPRRDFDTLKPARHIIVRSADESDVVDAADFATHHLPDLDLGNLSNYRRLIAFDPDCIQLFYLKEKLVGIFAMLFLNELGLSALANGDLIVQNPSFDFLAPRTVKPAAVYASLVVCPGRAVAGIGTVATKLRQSRFAAANIYARPVTESGRRIMEGVSFVPLLPGRTDLYHYVRLCNRNQIA